MCSCHPELCYAFPTMMNRLYPLKCELKEIVPQVVSCQVFIWSQ